MADIISLLPDSIANQIAAGEVIQRPASVVKELMENAIDANATKVSLIIKDAGKSLIQVVDNGLGMSMTDARMCFERHATSKIAKADDLFAIRSMGFRGEAMASIASVAQVSLKTKQEGDELGTCIEIEASKLVSQAVCTATNGTSVAVRNLFFNVPARRNFLKSTNVEFRHILEEFQRIALANEGIGFSLRHNDQEIFRLQKGNIRQRVVSIFGTNSNKKLVPIQEVGEDFSISGFIGKPEFAKKKRGEQYFFVNKRFIKSAYLNHAILSGYEELIAKDTYPLYVVYIDIDPSMIDINVHPTKQEIKFENEQLLYNFLKVGTRHGLGQHNIMPSLDFDTEASINPVMSFGNSGRGMNRGGSNPHNSKTVDSVSNSYKSNNDRDVKASNLKNWEKLYEGLQGNESHEESNTVTIPSGLFGKQKEQSNQYEGMDLLVEKKEPYQIHRSYIIHQIKSGYICIDQQAAHERILYERILSTFKTGNHSTQGLLFAQTINLSLVDSEVLEKILPLVNNLGFDIERFSTNSFIVNGSPAILGANYNANDVINNLIDQYNLKSELNLDLNSTIARGMTKTASIKRGQLLSNSEMLNIIEQLFATLVPYQSPFGRKCFITVDLKDLDRQFGVY